MPKNELIITRHLKERLQEALSDELDKVKFIPPYKEKPFKLNGKEWERVIFDLWSKRYGKKTPFAIWELEIAQTEFAVNNISKLKEILNWRWKPKVYLIHVFSPLVSATKKEECNSLAREIRKRYKNQLFYNTIHIPIGKKIFSQMKKSFEKNKNYAKSYYKNEIDMIVKSIVKESIKILKRV